MRLEHIYRSEIYIVEVGDSLAAAAHRMDQAQVAALAVLDGGRMVAIITARDVVHGIAQAPNPAGLLVSAHPSSRPATAELVGDLLTVEAWTQPRGRLRWTLFAEQTCSRLEAPRIG